MDTKDFLNLNSTIGISSVMGEKTVNQWVGAADNFTQLMNDTIQRHGNNPNAHGFIAEAFHTGSYNYDSFLKNSSAKATIGPPNHLTSDVRVTDSTGQIHDHQLKYYKTPNSTMNSISDPKYDGVGKVVPQDQINDIKYGAQKASENVRNIDQGNSYSQTAGNASDRIAVDNVQSKPLSYDESRRIQNNGFYTNQEVFKQFNSELLTKTLGGSLQASGIAILVSAGFDTVGYYLKNKKDIHSFEDFCKGAGKEIYSNRKKTITAGATAFVSYFSYSILRTGAFGLSTPVAANPALVGAITAFAIRTLVSFYDYKKGKITKSKFQNDTINGTVVTTGAVLGSVLIPIPIIGTIVGTTVASLGLSGWKKMKEDLPVLQITYEECFSRAYNTLCVLENQIVMNHRRKFDGEFESLSRMKVETDMLRAKNRERKRESILKLKELNEVLKTKRGRKS